MEILPDDCQRLIWKKVYDSCLQDMMKEVCVWCHILHMNFDCQYDDEGTGGIYPHVYHWEYFDRYYDMMEKHNITDEIEQLRYSSPDFNRLVDLIEEDNGIVEGLFCW